MQEQKRKNEKKYLEFNGGCGRKNREGEGGRRRLREGEGPKDEEWGEGSRKGGGRKKEKGRKGRKKGEGKGRRRKKKRLERGRRKKMRMGHWEVERGSETLKGKWDVGDRNFFYIVFKFFLFTSGVHVGLTKNCLRSQNEI